MTDTQTLFTCRLQEAEETLSDAERMLELNMSPRSVVNRSYYAMFYAALALFLRAGIHLKTAKHSGVLSTFDKEFVRSGRVDARFSKMFHRVFDVRMESDYKDVKQTTRETASEAVSSAREFVAKVKELLPPG